MATMTVGDLMVALEAEAHGRKDARVRFVSVDVRNGRRTESSIELAGLRLVLRGRDQAVEVLVASSDIAERVRAESKQA